MVRYAIFLSVLIFISGCGRKSPQTGDQAGTKALTPDSTLVSADSLRGRSANTGSPSEGQPAALMDTTLVRGRVGVIHVGMPVDSIYIMYGRVNVTETDLQYEGNPCPALGIHLPGGTEDNPSIMAEIGGNPKKVQRIQVRDSRFRTSKGIGPGSTFAELRKQYAVDSVVALEIGTLALVKELRMAFEIDPSVVPHGAEKTYDQKRIPGDVQIINVFVGWE